MNQLLSHLPTEKQEELERITELILKSTYIDSRYKMDQYKISKSELKHLADRV